MSAILKSIDIKGRLRLFVFSSFNLSSSGLTTCSDSCLRGQTRFFSSVFSSSSLQKSDFKVWDWIFSPENSDSQFQLPRKVRKSSFGSVQSLKVEFWDASCLSCHSKLCVFVFTVNLCRTFRIIWLSVSPEHKPSVEEKEFHP